MQRRNNAQYEMRGVIAPLLWCTKMPKTEQIPAQVRKLMPFLIIAIAVVALTQYRKGGSLAAPQLELISQETRSAENTDFMLLDLSDQPKRLSDFRGNVVLLNFFATWCPPCRDEMPTLEALYQEYKQRNFVVLGVAGDTEGKKIVEPFVQDFHVNFPIVLDPQHKVSTQYQVRGIPTIYLLDQHGNIAGMTVGGADWMSDGAKSLIETLLDEK